MRHATPPPSSSPATRLAAPAFTLVERGTTLWLFMLTAACIGVAWATEAALGQLAESDRVAYPVLMAWMLGLVLLVGTRPRHLVLAQGLASLALAIYFVATSGHMLLTQQHTTYAVASLQYWLVGLHVLIFVTWRPAGALALSGAVMLLIGTPAVWLALQPRPRPSGRKPSGRSS